MGGHQFKCRELVGSVFQLASPMLLETESYSPRRKSQIHASQGHKTIVLVTRINKGDYRQRVKQTIVLAYIVTYSMR
jgi:hypothetical protein